MSKKLACLLSFFLLVSLAGGAFAAGSFRFTVTGDPRDGYSRWQWVLGQITDKVGGVGAFHISCGDYAGEDDG